MEAKLFARRCSITGKGMSEGWVLPEQSVYISEESDCINWLKDNWKMTIDEAFEFSEEKGGDLFYWTAWEDPSDFQYIEIDGKLNEISEYFNH